MKSVTVSLVDTANDWREFLALPTRVYRGDAVHVAELSEAIRDELDASRNPIAAVCAWQPFIVRRGSDVVGRAVAIHNPRLDERQGHMIGLIGYFECMDDAECARAIIDHASAWCRKLGAVEVLAGINFSLNYQTGIQESGFDESHTFLMPHNPTYYPRLMQACGFVRVKCLRAYRVSIDPSMPVPASVLSRANALRRQGFTTRPMRKSDLLLCMTDYNTTWSDNYLHTELSQQELLHTKRTMKLLVDADFCLVAELGGQIVGYLFAFPDYHLTIRAWAGKVGLRQTLSFFWNHKVRRKVPRLKTAVIGVRPPYRRQGVSDLLNAELLTRAHHRGCTTIERSWILEDNASSVRQAERIGGKLFKTYAIYGRQFDVTAADNVRQFASTRAGVQSVAR